MKGFHALTICLVACVLVRAQQAVPTPQTTFRAGVDIVYVDVSVLGHDRRPVRGLTAADFTVQEDGHPRKVVAFTEIDLPARPPAPATAWSNSIVPDVATNTRAQEGRLVVILMDGSILIGDPTRTARRIATAAIDQLAPGDLASVVSGSAFSKNGTPQTFTSDRARLLAAINSPFFGLTIPPEMTPQGLVPGDPHDNDDVCWCGTCLLKTITRIATSVRDVPLRRKSLILIGGAAGIYLASPSTALPPASNSSASNTARECSPYVNDARTEMFDAVNRANLTIHAFDPTGLETLMDIPDFTRRRIIADRLERQDVLQTLAEKTGGTAVTNTNDPALFVPEAFRESESYYVLGFERSGAKANQPFHRIDVKVNRRGVDLRTRRGYFDAPDPARSPTASKTAVEALIAGALPDDGLPLRVVAEPFAAPGSFDPIVAVAASVTRGPEDARLAQVVGMVTAAFSLDGQSRGVDRQAFEIPPVSAADQATDWTFLSKLALKPGQYEIRVGLLPAGSSGGSVYLNIDVPDFGHAPLSLSGIMMSVQPDAPSVPAKLFDDLLPVRPSTRRAFRSTERVTALVRTYQGGASALVPVHLRARIVGADGGILATVPVELDPSRFASRAAEDTFNLPLHGLSPGQYLLTIDAAAGAHIARRDVPFAVK